MSIPKSIGVAEVVSKMHFISTLDGSGTYSEHSLYTKTTSVVVMNNGKSTVTDNVNHTSISLVYGTGHSLNDSLT